MTPRDWNPDRRGVVADKTSFLRDLANLARWRPLSGAYVYTDARVAAFFSSVTPSLVDSDDEGVAVTHGQEGQLISPEYFRDLDAVLIQVRTRPDDELLLLVERDPSVVWLTAGTSISGPATDQLRVRRALRRATWFAVAGCSAFNAGYAGISVFDGPLGLRRALFFGGHVFERPDALGEAP